MDEKIETWTLRFPAKENPYMGRALFDWSIVLRYNVKAKYRLISRMFLGHEVFSAERSLDQPKATRVCFRSINQWNRSISVRLLFLFCSRFHFKVIRKSLYLIWLHILTPKLQMEVRRGAGSAFAIAIATSSTTQITAEVTYALTSNTAGQGPSRGIQQPFECHKCYVRYTRYRR